jgi:hypothetical protein
MTMILDPYRFGSAPPPPSWDTVVASYSPILWFKFNEANSATFVSDGNFGSGGGTASFSGSGVTFGSSGIMPSDTSRKTVLVASGSGAASINLATAVTLDNCSIYFAYKGTTGAGAQIAWRNGSTGGYFIRLDTTDVTIRVNGTDKTTTYPSSSIKDGNPHLIGVTISSTTVALWVDGVKVWSSSATSSGTGTNWFVLQNSSFSDQKLYGNHGDYVFFNSTLTDPDHEALYSAWSGT